LYRPVPPLAPPPWPRPLAPPPCPPPWPRPPAPGLSIDPPLSVSVERDMVHTVVVKNWSVCPFDASHEPAHAQWRRQVRKVRVP